MTTKIEWCDETWNPITGCSKISPACDNCYAERMAKRLAGRYGYPKDDPFRVTFHPDRLIQPLKWKKPKRIFVCSMSDIFHNDVRVDWIDEIIQVICKFPEHIFMFLTKRPENIEEKVGAYYHNKKRRLFPKTSWFPKNIWLGVTVESQDYMWRVEKLLQIPAAVRFVSFEPMLGPVAIPGIYLGAFNYIHWVICGGETGPGSRPMHVKWVRSLRDQCQTAGVPFFFKGWGNWAGLYSQPVGSGMLKSNGGPCDYDRASKPFGENGPILWNIGKKKAGRTLDGRTWDEFPDGLQRSRKKNY